MYIYIYIYSLVDVVFPHLDANALDLQGRLAGDEVIRGKRLHQKSTPQESSWIYSGIFQWIVSGIFHRIFTFQWYFPKNVTSGQNAARALWADAQSALSAQT